MNSPKRAAGGGDDVFCTRFLAPHLEGVPGSIQPYFQLGSRLQAEWLTLWSNRTQAWLDWPGQLVTCRSVSDVARAQSDFLSTMQQHYATWCDCVLQDTLIEQDDLGEVGDDAEKAEAKEETPARPEQLHRDAA